MTDYGTDLSALPDLDPLFRVRSGRAVVGEAIARRLITPRGSLVGAPGYGIDIRSRLNGAMSEALAARLAADIESECEQDDRVQAAEADCKWYPAAQTLTVAVALSLADGPFTVNVTAAKAAAGAGEPVTQTVAADTLDLVVLY